MKKGLKIGLLISAGLAGMAILSSCTASFCDVKDQAHLLYVNDPGITKYSGEQTEGSTTLTLVDGEASKTIEGVYVTYSYDNSPVLKSSIDSAKSAGIIAPNEYTKEFYKRLDNNAMLVYLKARYSEENRAFDLNKVEAKDILVCTSRVIDNQKFEGPEKQIGHYYGDLKFITAANDTKIWDNFDTDNGIYTKTVKEITNEFGVDYLPSSDFLKLYKNNMQSQLSNFRTCLATNTWFYGSYGNNESILIHSKNYNYGWSKGLFEGLLIWPIGAFIDVLAIGFGAANTTNGVPQILAILVVTFIIRAFLLAVTFKSTTSSAKMNELQPEITKIQNKYPNANTNNYEKQRMAEEMQRLYKKNKINPLTALLVMVVQFPIFICVWGALSGSAVLTSGKFLGLNLSSSISSVLFVGSNWTAAGGYCAVTAFFLFLLMGGAQAVAMLLPQWIQKKKQKQVAQLGKNPAQKSQSNKMKWFTYIMLAVIIFMGFSLVSAMGVYWLVGAIFSILQTLITQLIMDHKKTKKE